MTADPLARAVQIAMEATAHRGRGPFGAVVTRDGEVVGEGANRVVEDRDPTAHAEIRAIRAASAQLETHCLRDCVIYCSCEPCPMCYAAIRWARIPRVVFAASREDAHAAGFDDVILHEEAARGWEQRAIEHEQRDRAAGREALVRWWDDADRTPY